jgi:hypothetical protein
MDTQARTGDTVLRYGVRSREITGRSWWLGGGVVKTTENKIYWLRSLLKCDTRIERLFYADNDPMNCYKIFI